MAITQESFTWRCRESSFIRMVSWCDLRPSEAREYSEFKSSMMRSSLFEESSGRRELTSKSRSGRSSSSAFAMDWASSANRSMLVQ